MSSKKAAIRFLYQRQPRRRINNNNINSNGIIIHNITGWNRQPEPTKTNDVLSLIHFQWGQYFNTMKTNNNGQYLLFAGSDKANNAMTSLPYNGEYFQNWKLYTGISNKANNTMISFLYNGKYFQNLKVIDCQHTSPDEMGPESQAPNTNLEAPNTNLEQKTSSDEMESEREAPNKNA